MIFGYTLFFVPTGSRDVCKVPVYGILLAKPVLHRTAKPAAENALPEGVTV